MSLSGFFTDVHRLMYGDDVSASNLPIATLQQALSLAEARIYSEVRSRHNEKPFSGVTVTGNLAPIPADFEACSSVHFGRQELEPKPEAWVREYLLNSPAGNCQFFAEAGDSFTFGPAVADATDLQGRYYYRWPALTSTNFDDNDLMANEPKLFLYCTLAEGAPLFGQNPTIWEAKYQAALERVNNAKNRAAYSNGRAKVRPSTRLIG